MRDQLLVGDAFTVLKDIPDASVQCIVTSPPYWGLRDYGPRKWFDETVEGCDHDQAIEHGPHHPGQVEQTKWKSASAAGKGQTAKTHSCSKCGAWYGQFGLEPRPEDYVRHLIELCRELRRILRPDGTFWLNIGDTFYGSAHKSFAKPKSLAAIPWKAAIALEADGWWLRSEVIWNKPNAMPESAKDRPGRAHEHIFLLTKAESYYYNYEAGLSISNTPSGGATTVNLRDVWSIQYQAYDGAHTAVFPPELPRKCILAGTSDEGACAACARPLAWNARDGWARKCSCPDNAGVLPCVVFDPFAGSGTTLAVAIETGRSYLGVEAFPEYIPLIQERLQCAKDHVAQNGVSRTDGYVRATIKGVSRHRADKREEAPEAEELYAQLKP